MDEKKLVAFIERNLKDGYTKDQIKQTLVKNGYSESDVKKYLSQAKAKSPSTFKHRNPWLVLLFSIITFGIYFILWMIFTTNEMRSRETMISSWWLLILLIPYVNLLFVWVFGWFHARSVERLTGKNFWLIWIFWLLFPIVAAIISQFGLNEIK